jgi:hypothetical protein
MLELCVRQVHRHPITKVELPNAEKIQQFAWLVSFREPTIADIIRFMDGVSFSSECTSEHIKQNASCCSYDCV